MDKFMTSNPKKRGALCLEPTEHQATAKRPQVQEANRARALACLKSTYGFDAFRGRQEEAVLAAMAGRDVLVIMPTGGGKTLCYVIPALVQPGLCVVVSPLLALMQDQVANLRAVGVHAAQLSSALPAAERAAVLADLTGGGGGQPSIRLLFVTPESLSTEKFRGILRRLHAARNLSLFAIDESHCISTWGHDFRPAYRRLQALRRDFPGVPIMALTATAAEQVQDDICAQLRLAAPVRLLSSFNRPNISYLVRYLDAEGSEGVGEVEALIRMLRERREAAGGAVPCSIVYCQKRDTCEGVAARLAREGLPAAPYHGQMPEAVKREVLRRWQADEVPVVVATIAFGMGIDKAGVRLVVHFNLPRSLEGFYQEAGRAGRDGRPAESVLFYSREARSRMDFVLKKDQEKKEEKKKGGSGAGDAGGGEGGDAEAAAACNTASPEERQQVQATAWKAFGVVVEWATAASCRRRALLGHFGERMDPGRCAGTGDGAAGGCDFCRDAQHVTSQLQRLKKLEEDAMAKRLGSGGWKNGGGGGDDEEADMFAERGGGGGGGNNDEGEQEGPAVYHAGRRSPQEAGDAAEVAAARSAAACARAAAGGQVNAAYFAALEARERQHERRMRESAGDVIDRMMSSGGGGGGGSGTSCSSSAPPPDAAARANATSKLTAAMAGNKAIAGLEQVLLHQLASAVEGEVYGTGLPRQQYTSRMAGLISRAKAATSPLALLPQSTTAAPAGAGAGAGAGLAGPPQQQPRQQGTGPSMTAAGSVAAAAAALMPALLQAEVSAIESLLHPQGPQGTATQAGNSSSHDRDNCSSSSSPVAGPLVAQAVARLRALATVAVTVGAVAAGGVGKRVSKLKKHASGEVAEAAKAVVAAWKRQLPEGPVGAQRQDS